MPSPRAAELVSRWWAGGLGGRGVLLDLLTVPLEWGFRAVVAGRNAAYDAGLLRTHSAGIPVISVGNLGVGGAGKTPVAAWLLSELKRRGRSPALLHGGYAGDEPALHARWHPDVTVIAQRDRVAGAARARAAGADVLVLDDGFQHRRIGRDLDLLLVAVESWGRRMRLLPRGPWREPADNAARATLIAVTRRTASPERAAEVAAALARLSPAAPVVRLQLRPAGWLRRGEPSPPPDEPALAVAAVADHASFVDNARSGGAAVAAELHWRDHHRYGAPDAALIAARAGGRPIVTTEKDWVKLEELLPAARVWVLRQEVHVEGGEAELANALDRALRS